MSCDDVHRTIMYAFLILTSIIGVLLFVRWLRKMIRFRTILNKYPGRNCNVLLGDVGNMSLNRVKLFRQIREHAKEFPDGYRLYASYYGSMNFITAEDVEVVLSSSKHIEKSAVYLLLHPWLGTGLLTSSGHKWSQRRKILTPAFHFDILRRFITIFGEHNDRLITELKIECNNAKTNIMPLISKHALNIICETAMGITINSGNEKMKDYQEAIYGLGGLMVARTLRFWLYKDFIYHLTSSGKKQQKYLKTLHQFTTEVIKERERTFNESDLEKENEEFTIYSKKRFSMLDLLILAKRQSGDIDDSGIREEVDTFMFEGHDTVASALSFTILMLANHKDIQDKVRAEIDEILQDSTRQPNYQDLQKMHYLSMCIKESLRLYPSVPFISRHIAEDVSIREGKYIIPEGCLVHIHIYDLHRNPKIFPEPNKFDPDRFLPENVIGRHPYAYIPFSAGPRNCIGQKFAMLEMKSVISSILRNFELEPIDTAANLVILMDIVLRPKAGIHVKFKPRVK